MVQKVVKYIEDAQKNGFALEEIKDHLSKHGWNDYLIEYAASQVERRSDRRWLQGSLMAVFAVMVLTSGTVWWADHKDSVGPMGIACVFESSGGDVKTFTNPVECCQKLGHAFCSPMENGPRLVDTAGQTVFVGQVSCKLDGGILIGQEKSLRSCAVKDR